MLLLVVMPRIKVLKWFLIIIFSVITLRLFALQVLESNYWSTWASDQQISLKTIEAERGSIYMMDGAKPTVVVMNQIYYDIATDPSLADLDKVFEAIEKHAKNNLVTDLETVKTKTNLRYYKLAKSVSRTTAMAILDEGVGQIYLEKSNKRMYPEGSLASGLLGFVNSEGVGQYGIEGALNAELAGKNGSLKAITDRNKMVLSIGGVSEKVDVVNGDDIVLSVDRNIQAKVEETLSAAVNNSRATNAAAIVMRPNNGEILAMASVPNYDPANYGNAENYEVYLNYTTEVPYEPASICKTFTFATAINEGVLTPDTVFYNSGYENIDGAKVSNYYAGLDRKYITIQTGFNNSLNVSTMYALKQLGGGSFNETGRKKLYEYFHDKFGFGEKTNVGVRESAGIVREPNAGSAMNLTYANMTFGQGMELTMVQVASAFAAVVNGGKKVQPSVIKGKMVDGKLVENEYLTNGEQIITAETSATMREMLYNTRSTQRRNGTDPAGYYVGGKTGTGQVLKNGEYSTTETIADYIGFGGLTAEMPEYVIMVKVWGADFLADGTYDARPLFDKISNFLISYLKIKAN